LGKTQKSAALRFAAGGGFCRVDTRHKVFSGEKKRWGKTTTSCGKEEVRERGGPVDRDQNVRKVQVVLGREETKFSEGETRSGDDAVFQTKRSN